MIHNSNKRVSHQQKKNETSFLTPGWSFLSIKVGLNLDSHGQWSSVVRSKGVKVDGP